MFETLSSCHDVKWIGYKDLDLALRILIKIQPLLDRILNVRRGYPYFNKRLAILKAKGLKKKVSAGNFDIIVSPNSPDLIAFLETSIPIVYIRDCTFQLFINYYPTFSNLNSKALAEGSEIERRAIEHSWRVVYSSEWAARSAINFYGADPRKVSIINFGANMPEHQRFVTGKSDDSVCHLLFIGIDWKRKGGEIAFKTFQKLKSEGIKCRLTIVGCVTNVDNSEDVEIVRYLDKTNAIDLRRLIDIYSKSHFLLLPTVADCTPIVFSEAAAFGIPVLTTDTGGNASVIHDGVNGFIFPAGSDEGVYADKIRSLFLNKPLYNKLRQSCRNEFNTRLSWHVWLIHLNNLLNEVTNSDCKPDNTVNLTEDEENVMHG
jgi:glycosyltransferase involved in cell wall biosynthesis